MPGEDLRFESGHFANGRNAFPRNGMHNEIVANGRKHRRHVYPADVLFVAQPATIDLFDGVFLFWFQPKLFSQGVP